MHISCTAAVYIAFAYFYILYLISFQVITKTIFTKHYKIARVAPSLNEIDMNDTINHKEDVNLSVSNFDKMFWIQDDKLLTFLF